MFGQPSTPFGSTQSTFGQTNTAPAFGSTFGAPAPAPTGFGGFGTPAPAPAPTGFGGFGAPAPAPAPAFGGSTFGAPAPAPSGFGATSTFGAPATSSPFGAPAPAPAGGLFGAPAPAPSSLFGAPAPAPGGAFGSTSTGFGFGSAPAPAPSAFGGSTFGAPAPAPGSLFGTPSPAPATGFGGTFGAPAPAPTFGSPAPAPSTSLFGGPAPAPAGGLFGAPAAAQGGTKAAPYQVTTRQDGTTNINVQAITAMAQYDSKSFDELRFEDYSQGNRGSAGSAPAPATSAFGFGAPAPAPAGGGLFGPAPAPAFGAPAPAPAFGSFGAPAPAPAFGAPAPAPAFGGFGSPAPAPAFGAPAPAPAFGGFGAPAPAPAGGSLFGTASAPAGGSLFGTAPTPAPGSLFGPAPAPAFGAPAPASGSLFGPAPAPAPGSLFGPAPAPAFGATPAPAPGGFGGFGGFGAPAPAPTSIFGAPAPAPAFGASPAPTSFFGAPAPTAGGIFGQPSPAPAPSMFGAPAPTPSAFGAPPPAPATYGAPAPVLQMPAAPPAGTIIPSATSDILAHQLATLDRQRKEFDKAHVWSKSSSETSITIPANSSESNTLSKLTPVRQVYGPYRASPHSKSKIRPRGFGSPGSPSPSFRSFGNRSRHITSPVILSTSTTTRLVINPKPQMRLTLKNSPASVEESKTPDTTVPRSSPATPTPRSPSASARSPSYAANTPDNGSTKKVGFDYYQQVTSPDANGTKRAPGTPSLSKEGYKCSPPIETLQSLSGEELAAVSNFRVERDGFGKIEWEGDVDVRGADLDRIAVIEQSTVSMYLEDEEAGRKPPVGSKLNRPALLTLYNVYPKNGGAGANDEVKAKFARKVEKSTSKMGAEFISYDTSAGVWKMRVHHFSKYGLDDDESESDVESTGASGPEPDFESGERGGRSLATKGILKKRKDTPYKPYRVTAADDSSDDSEDEAAIVSDMDADMDTDFDGSAAMEEAEAAYASIATAMVTEEANTPWSVEDDDEDFHQVFHVSAQPRSLNPRFRISNSDLQAASSAPSICDRIAASTGMKSSQTDFGIRMKRSFRAGWSPNGTFLSLAPGSHSRLVCRRPVLSTESGTLQAKLLKVHEKSNDVDSMTDLEFRIPSVQGVSSSKVISSYCKSLLDDGNDEESENTYRQSISLLSCLQHDNSYRNHPMVPADQKHSAFLDENRQLSLLCQWLVSSCREIVDAEISEAKRNGQPFAAILAAVSGGDMEKACAVAYDVGCAQLACLLSSGPDVRSDILKKAHSWAESNDSSALPEELIRIYFLLGGELDMEKDIYRQGLSCFDWRRRLSMQISFCTRASQTSISELIGDYQAEVASGAAPFPTPHYVQPQTGQNIQSTMFRLLRLSGPDENISLVDLVDPRGHTANEHDVALSFHLAAIASAAGYCKPMSTLEEQGLIDGYTTQLLNWGLWEWAVYVSLCSFSKAEQGVALWKEEKAKALITRYYCDRDASAEGKRQHLERLGLPAEWFEEALAYRSFGRGDVYAYLRHTAAYSPQDACEILEETIIPNILFMSKSDIKQAMYFVEAFGSIEGSLASSVFSFFEIHKVINSLEYADRDEINSSVPGLLEDCNMIHQSFEEFKSTYEKKQDASIQIVPEFNKVPMLCFLSEALAQVGLFKLQLRALQSGISIRNSSTRLINLISSEEFDECLASQQDAAKWFM